MHAAGDAVVDSWDLACSCFRGVGLDHDLLERGRRGRKQRGRQLDGGSLGGAEAAGDGEHPKVQQAAQRGGVIEADPGPALRGGYVGDEVEVRGVELQPCRVAEEVRHHAEDRPRQMRRRRVHYFTSTGERMSSACFHPNQTKQIQFNS